MEEETNVSAEETVAESLPETNQSVETESVSEDVQNTQVEADAKTVPYERFKEVLDQKKQLQELLSKGEAPTAKAGVGDDETRAYLRDVMQEVVSGTLGPVINQSRQAQSDMKIEQARRVFPDFDEHLPKVIEVMQAKESQLKNDPDALTTAYLIVKGMTAAQAVKEAKAMGAEEAVANINQKKQAATTKAGAQQPAGGASDLITKYKAGELSPEMVRANWGRIVEEMAGN